MVEKDNVRRTGIKAYGHRAWVPALSLYEGFGSRLARDGLLRRGDRGVEEARRIDRTLGRLSTAALAAAATTASDEERGTERPGTRQRQRKPARQFP